MTKKKKSVALNSAKQEFAFQGEEDKKRMDELIFIKKEIALLQDEKEKRETELLIANKELAIQNEEQGKCAAELLIANKELTFQNEEKGKQAEELNLAYAALLKAQEKIINGNRLYSFISHTNKTIVRVKDEQTLFNDACSIAVNKGGFKMAWIGIVDILTKKIKPVASCAASETDLSILTNYSYVSKGSIEKTMEGISYVVISDIQKESETPWNKHAKAQGFNSAIYLSIKKSGKVIGVFGLNSSETNFFDMDEINMLTEAANDISFAVTLFEDKRKGKIIQQKLELSESRLKEAQVLGAMGNWEINFVTNTSIWSDEFFNIFGIKREEITPSPESFISLLHPDDVSFAREGVDIMFQTNEAGSFNSRFIKQDGSIGYIYVEWKFEFDKNKKPLRLFGILQDITQTKKAEEALRISEANLQTIFENTTEGFTLVDKNGIIKTFNSKAAQNILLNTEKELKIGSNIIEFILPSRIKVFKGFITKALAGETIQYDYSYVRQNGDTKWFSITVNPAYNKVGAIEGICIASVDITKRKEAEQTLRESETFNKGVLSSLSSHIAVIDDRGTIIAVNQAWNDFAKANGITILERVSTGSNYFDVCNKAIENGDSIAAQALAGIKSVFKKETQQFEMEYPCNSPEQQRWFIVRVIIFGTDAHKVVISHQDISGRKHAEQSLQQSQSNLKAIIENTDATIYSLDTEFRYMAFNKSLYNYLKQLYGLDIKIGDHVFNFLEKLNPEEANEWKEINTKALKGETIKFEKEFNIGGYHNYSSFTIYPIWENKTVVGLSCFVYDITKQKEEEKQKEKMIRDIVQRNKNLEQFSYIVSHNLRAPVANILGLTNLIEEENITAETKSRVIEGLSVSAKKLDDVIRDLNNILEIKHDVSERKELINFSHLVSDIKTSIAAMILKENAILISDFSEVSEILTIKSYFHSIFYNLISNSLKYRQLNVSPLIEIKSQLINNKIILLFKDNGLGIDLDIQYDNVFGLYKRFHINSVEGKGIGLFMVKTQVEAIGGTINIKSEVNKGTEFRLEFPI